MRPRGRAARWCGPLSVQDLASNKEAARAVGTSLPHPHVPTQMDGLGGCLLVTPSYCDGKWGNTHAPMTDCDHQWGSRAMPVSLHAAPACMRQPGSPPQWGPLGRVHAPHKGLAQPQRALLSSAVVGAGASLVTRSFTLLHKPELAGHEGRRHLAGDSYTQPGAQCKQENPPSFHVCASTFLQWAQGYFCRRHFCCCFALFWDRAT